MPKNVRSAGNNSQLGVTAPSCTVRGELKEVELKTTQAAVLGRSISGRSANSSSSSSSSVLLHGVCNAAFLRSFTVSLPLAAAF